MREEVCASLRAVLGGVFLDATFGGGGHARALLEAHGQNEVWAVDRDPEAEPRAAALEKNYPGRLHFYRKNFSAIDALPGDPYDGALLDLGLSSFQLEDPKRGFSFRRPAPLDMRMDPTSGPSAEVFLATASREELVEAIRDFGEERHWRRIVQAILSHRGQPAVQRSDLLGELVLSCYPLRERFEKIHPATRTFQGIRIAVNRELFWLQQALPKILERLKSGGRFAVLSFHSLEDRIVKQFFRKKSGLPRSQGAPTAKAEAFLVTPKVLRPSGDEVLQNPRSRSARLRVLEKL